MESIVKGGENLEEQKILAEQEVTVADDGTVILSEDTLSKRSAQKRSEPMGSEPIRSEPKHSESDGSVPTESVEQLLAEQEEKLRQVRIDGEVRYVLAKMGAKNPTLAAKVLDLSRVQADDEGVIGVEEAVQQLMVSDPYLFGHAMGPVGGERSSGGKHGGGRRDPASMSDKEYYAYVMGKR